jgi:hypothetical protein
MTTKKFYSPYDLAAALRVNVETVRRWIRQHRLWHIHDPGRIRISHDEYEYIFKHGVRSLGSGNHGLGPNSNVGEQTLHVSDKGARGT